MKSKRFIPSISILIVFFIFMVLYYRSPLRQNNNYPILSGSFIQIGLTQNWNENDWIKELKYLTQDKMKYVVLTDITSTSNNVTKTVYNTNLPGTEKIYGNRDELDLCLKAAEKSGVKVFLGTDFNSEWWQKSPSDVNWFISQMNRTNLICNDLYKKYHEKYPHAFYGWYFPYEVDNLKFNNKLAFENLSRGININLNYLDSKKERLPFMMSPFMNSMMGTPKEYADNWKYFFSITNFNKGDVFCPQDSVGAGGLDINEVNSWFTALRRAVDTKSGLEIWANAESFDYVNSSSANLDRFINQLQLEQPCVDKIISFSYSHYYSPNNINPGFNNAYLTYVKTGRLQKNKVAKPENLDVKVVDKDEFKLTWNAPNKNNNIAGYKIYRNGVLIFNPVVQRKYGGKSKEFYLTISDKPILKQDVKTYTYVVKSMDFAGNLSSASNPVTVKADALKILSNLVSKGCSYTLDPQPDYNYVGDEFTKLTDGEYSSNTSLKDKTLEGWYNKTFNIQIDLKETKQVRQFMVDYYRKPRGYAMLPKAASVAVSQDGVNFTPIGLIRIPDVPFSDRGGTRYPLYLTLKKSVKIRYVRITSITQPNYYTFIDEFQIRE